MYLKVIACEIAVRELCHVVAQSRNIIDLEFVRQGHHDKPAGGQREIQERIEAVPAGKYDAVVLGYGLCSSMVAGLTARHTPLVIPRGHDCITLFLGSKERYRELFESEPGTYYYTSGWLECAKRRGEAGGLWGGAAMPAGSDANLKASFEQWALKYGEEQAKYLMEELGRWTEAYTRGALIDFDFAKHLKLEEEVRRICGERGWEYDEVQGDLGLLRRLVDGDWAEKEFLVVKPGQKVVATCDERVICAE